MKAIVMVILLMLTFSNAKDNDIYGADGQYKGYVDDNGDIYGNDGSYKGYVEDSGNIYGANGSYKGEVED